ncbi:VOC family protein [Saccharopolyspora sp. 6M]|uniref:VOC family protein n=1 Tax=Saccharopolyspora sp. 6M TaxID=2877237 RepID=UPI001CD7AC43|nr:VOC family protein [Saccharopolyspora sp. 6M]MCA1226269.1 VOC family protein [Saccharopolyspora sp. 6M]
MADTGGIDLDHTSFAVHDALSWARRLRREIGVVPIAGESLPEFRYLLLQTGERTGGARLELLEPTGPGFLTRHLDKRGEGPHHLTFSVPDLRAAVARVRELGAEVVGEDYGHAPWREAFLPPGPQHRTVIQLAQSDRAYPSAEELRAGGEPDVAELPSVRGATEPHWWASTWETPAGAAVPLHSTHLDTADLAFSRRLFHDVLGGRVYETERHLDFSWPGGTIRVRAADRPGVRGMGPSLGGGAGIGLGSAVLGLPG